MTQALPELCKHPAMLRDRCAVHAALGVFSVRRWLVRGFPILQGGKEVAVKLFKGEVSPDGRAADEVDVTCSVNHPNLTK